MTSMAETIIQEALVEANAAASASSGGVHSSSNQTTVTGNSSASVQVTNVINGSSDGGTSHTIIEKTVDGVTTREEETKEFDPGEPIHVDVSVEAKSGEQNGTSASNIETEVEVTADSDVTNTAESSATSSVVSSARDLGSFIADTISNLVSGFLNLFR